jgi:hypothetical protein
MRHLILAAALALAALPAAAQTNWTETPGPGPGRTTIYGQDPATGRNWIGGSQRLPDGSRQNQLNGSDGSSTTCRSARVGNSVVTNCW